MEPSAVAAIEEQARSEAREAYRTYLAVLTPVEGTDKHFKGVGLARTIWTALDRGLDEAVDASLATLAGFRLGDMLGEAPELQTPDFVDLASAYVAVFGPEFRRIQRAMRAPGPEKDAMFAYLMADDGGGSLRPWAKAFASAEAPSGWERSVQAAAARDEEAKARLEPR
jgi:hypothetical protein